jgi:hypothetical protein
MPGRAAWFGLVLLLGACVDQVMLYDLPDAGGADATVSGKDAAFPPPGDAYCDPWYESLNYTTRTAQLMILLDRSLAMQASFGGTTIARAAQDALLSAVQKYQGNIEFGFVQFPAASSDKTYADCARGFCCAGSVAVYPQTDDYSLMSGAIQCTGPFPCPPPTEESHASAALAVVRDTFSKFSSSRNDPRYVLLVTASEPSCANPDGGDACYSALNVASDLGDMKVGLAVLAVDFQPGPNSCLAKLSSQSYTPTSVGALNGNVDDFVSSVARSACTLDLEGAPPSQIQPTVSLGMSPVEEDKQNGWSFANYARTSITLSGRACDDFLRPSSGPLYVGYFCSTCGGSNSCWQ